MRWNAVQPVTIQSAPLKKAPAVLLAALFLAPVLLAGCGGDPKPDTSPSIAATPPSRTTTTTPSPPSPTAAARATTDPNVPAAARAHTPAGAEAFVRHFYSQLNLAWSKPQAGLISSMSASTCKSCANFEQEAAKSVAKNERVIGRSIVLATVDTSDATKPDMLTVVAIGRQPKTVVVDAKGKAVQSLKEERVRTSVVVEWVRTGWRIREIQNVA